MGVPVKSGLIEITPCICLKAYVGRLLLVVFFGPSCFYRLFRNSL
jgi:hypothetical protein